MHLFTMKDWLGVVTTKPWARYTEFVAGCAPNLRYLTFTLGNENNLFEAEQDIVPNAKKWRLSEVLHTKGSNSFEEFSWVDQLRAFGSLNVMEVEIGTLKKNKEKLDLYIAKAAGWRIPLAKEKEMVFNPGKTKWEGWHGLSLGERMAVTNGVGGLDPRILVSSYGFKSIPGFHKDPVAARKRLIGAGVDFKIAEDALENTSDDCETYCVVTLVFEAT